MSTDFSSTRKPHVHTRVSLRQPLRCGFAILICSCLFAGAAQCRGRVPQDVAEAARQERARKDAKKPKHVYTDEDLRRERILTPEDQAELDARRKAQPTITPAPAEPALDANAEMPQLPLGDIARRYRNAKLAAQAANPFHLPFDEPVFADPAISAPEVAAPRPNFAPAHPNFVPARPQTEVAPALSAPAPESGLAPSAAVPRVARPAGSYLASHPNLAPAQPGQLAAPSLSNRAAVRRVDPFAKRFAPTAPAAISHADTVVAQPKADAATVAAPKSSVRVEVAPAAPRSSGVAPVVAPSNVAASMEAKGNMSRRTVTVRPGDSLWKLAQENLGRGARWQELLAVNPGIEDPARIAAGTEIILPANQTGMKSDMRVTVKQGDTLTQIAKLTYGRAAAWQCIEQANPEITDANHIYTGQQLLLPFGCKP